jgi:hypothetical protein
MRKESFHITETVYPLNCPVKLNERINELYSEIEYTPNGIKRINLKRQMIELMELYNLLVNFKAFDVNIIVPYDPSKKPRATFVAPLTD